MSAGTASVKTRRRVAKGVAGNLLGQVINIANQFALVPVFLSFWGRERYGEWLTLSAAAAYVLVLDMGMTRYIVNRMTQAWAREDLKEYSRLLHSSLLWSVLVAATALFLIVPVVWAAPLTDWFQLRTVRPVTADLVAILLACQVALSIPIGVLGAVYISTGNYPRSVFTENVTRLGLLLGTATLLVGGFGMVELALVPVGVSAAMILWVTWDIRRRFRQFRLGFRDADLRLSISFIGPSALFLLIQAAMALRLQGATLLVGSTLGAAAVAGFVTIRTLANALLQLVVAVQGAIWPEVTALHATGKHAELRELLGIMTKVLLTGAAVAGTILYLSGPELVQFWTRGRLAYDAALMTGLLLAFVSESAWATPALVLMASNHQRVVAGARLAAVGAGLVLGAALMPRFGVAGVAYGLFAADVLICGWVISRAACRHVSMSFAAYLRATLLRGLPILAGCFAAITLLWQVLPAGWPAIGVISFATPVLTLAAAYVWWLSHTERHHLNTMVRGFAHDLALRGA